MWRAARRWIRGYESSNTPAQSAPRNSRRFTESAPIFFRSGRRRHHRPRSQELLRTLLEEVILNLNRSEGHAHLTLGCRARRVHRLGCPLPFGIREQWTLLCSPRATQATGTFWYQGFADYWLCRLPRGNLLVYGSLPADAWATNSRWQTALCRPCALGMQPQTARLRRG